MSYLSPDDVASQLGVTGKTIREWLKSEELIGVKLGGSWKIHETDLSRFVDGQRLQALLKKAAKKHPNIDWIEDQCETCGEVIPAPDNKNSWVCSVQCKKTFDRQLSTVLDCTSEDFACSQSRVIPHF